MKVLVQWARQHPRDWEEIDSSEWASLPSRPHPVPGQVMGNDDTPGWISAICVQGVVFEDHDHYAVEDIPGGCRVTMWDTDSAAFFSYRAVRWTFLEPAPDPRYGGALNTRQSVEFFADVPVEGAASGGSHRTHAADTFVPPTTARHGVLVSDSHYAKHQQARSVRNWREWSP